MANVKRGDANVNLIWSTPLHVCANAIRMSHDNHHLSDSFALQQEADERYISEHISCGMCGSRLLYVDEHISCQDCGYAIPASWHTGKKDRELIYRVGNKMKHKSVLEQLVYWFDVDGISRACLQELARHRMARLTVKSTRYTLKELKKEDPFLTNVKIGDALDIFHYISVEPNSKKRAKKYLVFTGDANVDARAILSLEFLRQMVVLNVSNDISKYSLPEAYKVRLQWQIDMRNLQNFLELRLAKEALWEIRDLARKIANALPDEHKYLVADIVKEKFPEMYDEGEWDRFASKA